MLDPYKEFVIQEQWLPVAPVRDQLKDPMESVAAGPEFYRPSFPDHLVGRYHAGFASIAERTPDLHLYKLIQIFNTPLLNIPLSKANEYNYSFWKSIGYKNMPPQTHCHLWTYRKQPDNGLIVAEYRFDGQFALHSPTIPAAELAQALVKIAVLIHQDS